VLVGLPRETCIHVVPTLSHCDFKQRIVCRPAHETISMQIETLCIHMSEGGGLAYLCLAFETCSIGFTHEMPKFVVDMWYRALRAREYTIRL
jgi:hypothetical protein